MLTKKDQEKVIAMRSGELFLGWEGQCWTDDERRKLMKHFSDGYGITDFTVLLDRSETAVIQQVEHLQLHTRSVVASRKPSKVTICRQKVTFQKNEIPHRP